MLGVPGIEPVRSCLQRERKAGVNKFEPLFGLRLADNSTRTKPRIAAS